MEKEIWKQVPIYPYGKLYEVSTLGRVRTIRDNRIYKVLKLETCPNGYLRIALHYNKKIKRFLVHRLVMMTFSPNWDDRLEVNHIDGDKTNNQLSNLEMVTHAYNMRHSYCTKLRPAYSANLTREQVREIRKTPMAYKCNVKLAQKFGVPKNVIHDIRAGVTLKYID